MAARAKTNLLLDVLHKRNDGYHELETIMQSLELHDCIEFEEAEDISLKVKGGDGQVPAGPENLVWRAAAVLREYTGVARGVKMTLRKNIPVAAGLGGGSADAAAVLKGLNELWGLDMETHELAGVGAQIGSDVPFCVYGGTALVGGRGERVMPLPPLPRVDVVLAKPYKGLSTAKVYKHYDLFGIYDKGTLDTEGMVAAIREGNVNAVVKLLGNALEKTAISLLPVIGDIKKTFVRNGALGVLVSGSGPTVLGVAEDPTHAKALADGLAIHDVSVVVTKTADGG
ncbi:MAG TPA: 4-(cytidine 5'-diphospho)-2-C-methyl-D-erythritol kinase [Clostridia bacterium]|nr:4-(cytidine 5'-diphospho)-2-C-methyl-D-erythritol kinase [Clostridia bacterium]